ncbi:MAG: Molybdate-binding protein [Acidimicrobiales bacterium]|nr:Molybdate-binding protein [Acidimicrobiales bacterium]
MSGPYPAHRSSPGASRRRRSTTIVALLLSVGLVSGCGSSSTSSSAKSTTSAGAAATVPPVSGSITVSAAASLKGVFATLGSGFQKAHPGTQITFNFGSSGTLETQIESGAPADAAAFADTSTMKKLAAKALLAAPATVFAKNLLIIVTKPGNPKGITTLADLSKAGTVALCGTTVPCGKYAAQILKSAGVTIPTWKITRGVDVKATLGAVSAGDADAAIVYVTDARAAGRKVASVAIPAAQNALASYPIAVLRASSHQPLAQAFEAYVMGPAGQAVLRKAGFLAP